MTHTLENEVLRIKIEDHGAELSEIYDKEKKRQVLWQADPAYWKRHAPVLFPNVGRYYKDRCQINGKTYCCGQHGFARDMDFVCTEESNVSVTHCLTSSDATREFYPFTFELYITHQLHGKDVSVSWKVINKDTETMFFTIGGHPAFRVPVLPDTSRDQYFLTFSGQQQLTYCLLDLSTGTALPDQTRTLPLENGACRIDPHMFDRDALIFDNNQITKAGIALPDGTPYVELICQGFPSFGIWSSSMDAPFVCLEPWMGRCDNSGFEDELSQKPNINKLDSDGVFEKAYVISIK